MMISGVMRGKYCGDPSLSSKCEQRLEQRYVVRGMWLLRWIEFVASTGMMRRRRMICQIRWIGDDPIYSICMYHMSCHRHKREYEKYYEPIQR